MVDEAEGTQRTTSSEEQASRRRDYANNRQRSGEGGDPTSSRLRVSGWREVSPLPILCGWARGHEDQGVDALSGLCSLVGENKEEAHVVTARSSAIVGHMLLHCMLLVFLLRWRARSPSEVSSRAFPRRLASRERCLSSLSVNGVRHASRGEDHSCDVLLDGPRYSVREGKTPRNSFGPRVL